MGIFAIAALAGFLLFGCIECIQKSCSDSQKLRLQRVLGVSGLLALLILTPCVIVLTTQWPSYEVFRIVQVLTGRETAQFILGAAFGCLLQYWGPDLWALKIATWPRYDKFNWVAISLAGLILLAAAVPYIGSLLRNSGMTGLKTPFAEFQFASKVRADLPDVEKDLQTTELTNLKKLRLIQFSKYLIEADLIYLDLFPKTKVANHREIYQKSLLFTGEILDPLGKCALKAYTHPNYLDIESIRHELQPIAQILYLLIQEGKSILELQSQDSKSEENSDDLKKIKESNAKRSVAPLHTKFLESVNKSLEDLNGAFIEDRCKSLDPESSLNADSLLKKYPWLDRDFLLKLKSLKDLVNPKTLANAPHIYLALAYLDAFNRNVDRTIFLLESASQLFNNHAPLVSFHINYSLAFFLRQEGKNDINGIFLYLDNALEIAWEATRNINELSANRKAYKDYLLKQLEFDKTNGRNFLAYISAEEGVRKFEALQYAKDNYNDRNKLPNEFWPSIIDTYGYAKMAFEARKSSPNFDEIAEARALFREAISHAEGLPDSDEKPSTLQFLRAHLGQANKLLALER